MSIIWQPPTDAKTDDDATAVECGSYGTEERTTLEVNMNDLLLSKSTEESWNTCSDSMYIEKFSMEECLRKAECLEAALKEAVQEKQDSVRQLNKARAYIMKKEMEVCDLQGQLLQELTERQRMFREVIQRDETIIGLQKCCASSKARASDVGINYLALDPVLESRSGFNAGSSNFAGRVEIMPATNLHANPFPGHAARSTHTNCSMAPSLPIHVVQVKPMTRLGTRQVQTNFGMTHSLASQVDHTNAIPSLSMRSPMASQVDHANQIPRLGGQTNFGIRSPSSEIPVTRFNLHARQNSAPISVSPQVQHRSCTPSRQSMPAQVQSPRTRSRQTMPAQVQSQVRTRSRQTLPTRLMTAPFPL